MKKYIYGTLLLIIFFIHIPIKGQKEYQIRKIEFKGNQAIEEKTLLNQINTRELALKEKILFWKKKTGFSSFILKNDIDRLHSFYQRHGFLNPKITYKLKKNERRKKLDINIHIQEGKPVNIQNISFTDLKDTEAQAILQQIKDQLPLKEGKRFIDQNIFASKKLINRSFSSKGYPLVQTQYQIKLNPDKNTASVYFNIQPGPKSYFGKTTFRGDSIIPEKFLRKQLKYSKGELYSQTQIEASQNELFNTDLFQYAIIRSIKDSINNNMIPISVHLKEKPAWSLEAGVGYGSEDQFRVSAMLTRIHFLGGARKMIIDAKRSYFLPVSLETKFIQPDLLDKKIDLILNPFFIREKEKSYEVDRLGFGISLQHQFSQKSSGYLMYSYEKDYLTDRTEWSGAEKEPYNEIIHNKSGLTAGFNRNTTSDPFNPKDGWKIKSYLTYMGLAFQSRFHYLKTELDIRHYKEIAMDWVIAGKIKSGFIKPLRQDEETPIEDRFLLGGASSLRGWGRHEISPVNEQGNPIGGNNITESSLELRFPVYKIFSGVVFTDAGIINRKAFEADFSHIYWNIGTGVRINTPIGPVRGDVGIPVGQEKKKPAFFISLGHSF